MIATVYDLLRELAVQARWNSEAEYSEALAAIAAAEDRNVFGSSARQIGERL